MAKEVPLDRQEARRTMMLTTPISRLVPKMAIPTIVSMLVTSLYNMADTYFVSMLPGDAATGAVGINMSLMAIIQMFGMAIATGANSYISRLLGAKRDDEANRTLSTTFFTAFGIGLFVMIAGLTFLDPLMSMLGAKDPEVLRYSRDYASFILYAAPFMAAQFLLSQCLRAEGSAMFSMIGITVGAAINVVLDPIFIFTFGMEVKGAAAATAISQVISFCVLLYPYFKRHSLLRISIKSIKFSKAIITEVAKMGFPTMLRNGLMSLATIVTNNVAQGFSVEALAAISVVNRIMMFVTSAILGYGQGFQPVAGFNYGAKRYDRVMHAFKFASFTGVSAISVLALVVGIFAPQIMAQFSTSQITRDIGVFSIRLQCIVMPIHAWCIVVNMMYAALGRAVGAALLSLSRQGLFFIPTVAIMSLLLHEYGLASAQAVADTLSLTLAIPYAVIAIRSMKKLQREMVEAKV